MHIITMMNILNYLHILTSCASWNVSVVGSCLFAYGLKQGELCRRDNDCETGLLCSDSGGESRTCQPPNRSNKQYSEFHDWIFKKSAYRHQGTFIFSRLLYKQLHLPVFFFSDDDCTMSGECDVSRGLCCQLQRRHRQAARKVKYAQ